MPFAVWTSFLHSEPSIETLLMKLMATLSSNSHHFHKLNFLQAYATVLIILHTPYIVHTWFLGACEAKCEWLQLIIGHKSN